MTRIAYRMMDGRACDIRFVSPAYVLLPDERETVGDKLPGVASLTDPSVLAVDAAAALAREERAAALELGMASDELLRGLREFSPEEISSYVHKNVTDIASARALLAKLACAIAYALR